MSFDYSVGSMLPFARAAIRHSSNFEPRGFAELLFAELEKAGVPGVFRAAQGQYYRYDFTDLRCPAALRLATVEVFFYLVHQGFVLPQPQSFPVSFDLGHYWKTERGTAWANGTEPPPEDVAGYMASLTKAVPSSDPIIRQYVQEGLGSFRRQMYFSAAVMLGAASEKEVYLVAADLVAALKGQNDKTTLEQRLSGRSLYRLLSRVEHHVTNNAKLRGVFEGAVPHLMSLFESIRVQRNEAVHPSAASVNEDSVRLAYESFPKALERAEALRGWFRTNPNSL